MTAADIPRQAYKVPAAAMALDVSEDTIYAWITSGVLRARKVNSQWLIAAASVEHFFDDPDEDAPAVAHLAARLERLEARLGHEEAS